MTSHVKLSQLPCRIVSVIVVCKRIVQHASARSLIASIADLFISSTAKASSSTTQNRGLVHTGTERNHTHTTERTQQSLSMIGAPLVIIGRNETNCARRHSAHFGQMGGSTMPIAAHPGNTKAIFMDRSLAQSKSNVSRYFVHGQKTTSRSLLPASLRSSPSCMFSRRG